VKSHGTAGRIHGTAWSKQRDGVLVVVVVVVLALLQGSDCITPVATHPRHSTDGFFYSRSPCRRNVSAIPSSCVRVRVGSVWLSVCLAPGVLVKPQLRLRLRLRLRR
jgi:hypothetical protein